MTILVSACLLGENCKYNGKNNRSEALLRRLRGHTVVPVCPEVLAGLGTPRPCVELQNGRAVDCNGRDVDAAFRAGVQKALQAIAGRHIDLAVLQSRSPTCGVKQIYDGSFSKRLIDGQGMLAAALQAQGVPLLDVEDLDQSTAL